MAFLPLVQRHDVGRQGPLHISHELRHAAQLGAPPERPRQVVARAGGHHANGGLLKRVDENIRFISISRRFPCVLEAFKAILMQC